MNANTVPKLPNYCLFLTLQLLCSIKARAPSKNPPPFACLFFPSGWWLMKPGYPWIADMMTPQRETEWPLQLWWQSPRNKNHKHHKTHEILPLGLPLLGNVEAFDLGCNFVYPSSCLAICIGHLIVISISRAKLPDPNGAIFWTRCVWFTTRCKPDTVDRSMMPFVTSCIEEQLSSHLEGNGVKR